MRATVAGVAVRGVAAALPAQVARWEDAVARFGDDARRIAESTGVRERPVAPPGLCASDLCEAAASRLLDALGWPRASVDVLVFVSQTPDHVLPATACVLHGKLGLSPACAALDVGLGCSGYVYGLWLAASLLRSAGAGAGAGRALVLVGDTINRVASPLDRATALLFGDAGTATALEYAGDEAGDGASEASARWHLRLGTEGAGRAHLCVPAGGFREPRGAATATVQGREGGNARSDEQLYMNGAEVFSFALRAVPTLARAVLADAGRSVEQLDAVVLHQANQMMLQHLGRRLKVPEGKLVCALERYGNTNGASIPLALCADEGLGPVLRERALELLLVGFGVGWSYGAAVLRVGPLVVPPLLRVEAPAASPTPSSPSPSEGGA